MKIRILGGGWYGCHLASALIADGHEVVLIEKADHLFSGASGGNPARLHQGFHYPRSFVTRAACTENAAEFMAAYGQFTRAIPVNLYAVAAHESVVDFRNYVQSMGELPFIEVHDPKEFGLTDIEGAVLTGERHIVIREARAHFEKVLAEHVLFGEHDLEWRAAGELVIDCTFCSFDSARIDRYEPCVTGILKGPVDRAVTVMDGKFPSVYPWDEAEGLSSLTSAQFTPLARCPTHQDARQVLQIITKEEVGRRCADMLDQMRRFWPDVMDQYTLVDAKLSIRAMPLSGADSRLVDVAVDGPLRLRVRAGKIDAVVRAERLVKEFISCSR